MFPKSITGHFCLAQPHFEIAGIKLSALLLSFGISTRIFSKSIKSIVQPID